MTEARRAGEPPRRELERRVVTVLFCDLADFTSLSERLDAEDVAIVQNAYFDAVRQAVGRHGGTLEKFIGDAAVAVFGVPTAGERDAERAVRCGLAVVGAIEQLGTRVGLDDGALHVRVGVNTGEAVVHPSAVAGEAMVTGDVVNTAARLQSSAPLNGVLLGPETALAVAHAVELELSADLELERQGPTRSRFSRSRPSCRARARARDGCAQPPDDRSRRGALPVGRPSIGVRRQLSAAHGHRSSGHGKVPASGRGGGACVRARRGCSSSSRASGRPLGVPSGRRARQHALAERGSSATLKRSATPLVSHLGSERAVVVADELAALLGVSEDVSRRLGTTDARSARFAAWSAGIAALDERPEVWLDRRCPLVWERRPRIPEIGDRRTGRLIVCTSRPVASRCPTLTGSRAATFSSSNRSPSPSTASLVRALVGERAPGRAHRPTCRADRAAIPSSSRSSSDPGSAVGCSRRPRRGGGWRARR